MATPCPVWRLPLGKHIGNRPYCAQSNAVHADSSAALNEPVPNREPKSPVRRDDSKPYLKCAHPR